MQRMQLDSKEQILTGFGGVSNARNIPERAHTSSRAVAGDGAEIGAAVASRGWARTALRFVRNAAIGIMLISAVPLGVIGWNGSRSVRNYAGEASIQVASVQDFRALQTVKDLSITPLQAGQAFRSLLTRKASAQFPATAVVDASARPWKSLALPKGFEFLGDRALDRTASLTLVLQAAGGFTEEQLAYLRAIAEASLWQQYDRVAQAQSVDMIAGVYQLPFREGANALDMPLLQYADTRELASAGIARAAYYVAMKQPQRAEMALRSVASFGFALIDNGTSAMDAMIGRIIVNMGRGGLHQLGQVTGLVFAGADGATLSGEAIERANPTRKFASARDMRTTWIANAANRNLPQSLRYENLRELSMSTCRSASEVMFGESAEVRAAYDNADRTLARYPSDHAYLALLRNATNHVPQSNVSRWALDDFVLGAAQIAATVTHNSRIETCALVALVNK